MICATRGIGTHPVENVEIMPQKSWLRFVTPLWVPCYGFIQITCMELLIPGGYANRIAEESRGSFPEKVKAYQTCGCT